MSNTNTGGSAFPGFDYIDQHGKKNPEGMTLRDYFAAHAIGATDATLRPAYTFSEKAEYAYMMADAMLKARQA